MHKCGRCGHDNADHLAYCFSCGRRLHTGGGPTQTPGRGLARDAADGKGNAGDDQPEAALAATVALDRPAGSAAATSKSGGRSGPFSRSVDAIRYVFSYARGRVAAENRKRRLADERAGAARLLEGALIELGQLVLVEAPDTLELAGLADAIKEARSRREVALRDLAAAERFRDSEDLRLGLIEAAAETESKACETGAVGVDDQLRQFGEQRREIDLGLERPSTATAPADVGAVNQERAALQARRAHVDEQVGSLRERGAALRASTIAARARLDQAIGARRQTAASVAASIAAHTRDRASAEARIRETTTQLGRDAARVRPARPPLMPAYDRVDRLEETIADRDRQTVLIERMIGRYDLPKLATGIGLLTGILGVLAIGLWALTR